ncbi:MAG: TIGR00282 family metallophosphoesterase [bacterium]|nr:TIGR00282 family metallophosphoesterase [bacterium]
MSTFNVLIIGDVVGRPGREAVHQEFESLKSEYESDFTIVNVENSAAGFGITKRIYDDFLSLGVDAMTSGNHVYDKREFIYDIDRLDRFVRPINYPKGQPGVGVRFFDSENVRVAVVNAIGRVFMNPCDCPFSVLNAELPAIREQSDVIIVDFHAEATSEKSAIGYFLDGKVSAVLGTHTHVQTSDARLLPKGTAYMTDIGMVGATNTILGMVKEPIIQKFLDQMPVRFETPDYSSEVELCAVSITVDLTSNRTTRILPIRKMVKI